MDENIGALTVRFELAGVFKIVVFVCDKKKRSLIVKKKTEETKEKPYNTKLASSTISLSLERTLFSE